jgi:predicted Rossmann-fold nucleotide-binding protein
MIDPDHTPIATIEQIKQQHRIKLTIAFAGGAETKLPQLAHDDSPESLELQKAYEKILTNRTEQLVQEFLRKFTGLERHIAILTGGTKGGVPEIVSKAAKQQGFKTIGIYPETGCEHFLGDDIIDIPLCITSTYQDCKQSTQWETPSYWGDESSMFAKTLDAVVVIGGSAGTLIEMAYVLKMNAKILKAKKKGEAGSRKLKYIVPVSGFGGVSEDLHHIWADAEVKDESILSFTVTDGVKDRKRPGRIYSGIQAADALLFTPELAIRDLDD